LLDVTISSRGGFCWNAVEYQHGVRRVVDAGIIKRGRSGGGVVVWPEIFAKLHKKASIKCTAYKG